MVSVLRMMSSFLSATLVLVGMMFFYFIPSVHIDERDVGWLSLNIYHEARGESLLGIVGVADSVFNRITHKSFPNSLIGVVTQGGEVRDKCQYSWYCDGFSDRPNDWSTWYTMWQIAKVILIAKNVLGDMYPTVIGDAVFYYSPSKLEKLEQEKPCWAVEKTITAKIGNHVFHSALPWSEMKKLCRPSRVARASFFI